MIDTSKTIGKPETYNQRKIRRLLSEGTITNITNLEKAILSLEYLGQLHKEGLDILLKGGSAIQILLTDRWTRLSIDIDICTDATEEGLQSVMERIHRNFDKKAFSYKPRRRELDGDIPFYLYRIETPAITDKSRTILLDAMGTKPKMATQQTRLKTFFFDSTAEVATPTTGALLGDKLSTIGPTTIGRPLKDSRNGLEYAKHFYDINRLQETDFSLKECSSAFHEAINNQLKVRNKEYTLDQCFNDMLFTCQVASLPQRNGEQAIKQLPITQTGKVTSELKILQDGLRRFRPFLVQNLSYVWDDVRCHAARTALLIKMINSGITETTARKSLSASIPSKREEIMDLAKQIERLPRQNRWFILPSEIINFPKLLKTWYDYFTLSKLI